MKHPEKNGRYAIVLLLTFFLMIPSMALAFNHQNLQNHNAGKAFFDIDTGKLNQQSLAFVLGGISVTFDEMEALGVTPDFIVSFKGMNTGILSYEQSSEDVQMMFTFLSEKGVPFEVCSKAINLSGENQYEPGLSWSESKPQGGPELAPLVVMRYNFALFKNLQNRRWRLLAARPWPAFGELA